MVPSRARSRLVALSLLALVHCSRATPASEGQAAPAPVAEGPVCAAVCARIDACGPPERFRGVQGCIDDCAADPRNGVGRCREQLTAYEACMVRLSCDELKRANALELSPALPCAKETRAFLDCDPKPPPTPASSYFQF